MLHHVRYGDNGVVVKLYVRNAGLKSFMIKGLGSKKALVRPAYLQPLTLLEIIFEDIPHRELLHLKDARLYRYTESLHSNVIKTAIAFFMTEVIQRSIREFETNTEMFDFLENAIIQLNKSQEQLSEFPLWFLLRLARYLGFQPLNNASTQKPWFDLGAGSFTDIPPVGESSMILEKEVSSDFALMLTSYTSDQYLHVRFTHRKYLLDALLYYYSIHLPEFRELKTPAIFKEIFHL